jgi:hypothetical protein
MGPIRVIKSINIESVSRHLLLNIFLALDVLPELTGIGGTWHAAS